SGMIREIHGRRTATVWRDRGVAGGRAAAGPPDRLEDGCGIGGRLVAQQEALVGLRHRDFLDTIELAQDGGPLGLEQGPGSEPIVEVTCATAARGRSRTGGRR
ncbi:MAG: hypothetical protein J2P48_24720, partial [Alphaproteobacteria bacterium]|nr:hypothetical protein [Alphaproteobacteria bacterium]